MGSYEPARERPITERTTCENHVALMICCYWDEMNILPNITVVAFALVGYRHLLYFKVSRCTYCAVYFALQGCYYFLHIFSRSISCWRYYFHYRLHVLSFQLRRYRYQYIPCVYCISRFLAVLTVLSILPCRGVTIFCIFFPDVYLDGDTIFTIDCMYCRFS